MVQSRVAFNRVSHLLRCPVTRISNFRQAREGMSKAKYRVFVSNVNQEEEDRREEDLGS